MKREGRGRDPVGGVRAAGQLLCHGDSGEGEEEEEEEGWSDASLQEAARLTAAADSSPQGHSGCAESSGRRSPPPRQSCDSAATEAPRAESGTFITILSF